MDFRKEFAIALILNFFNYPEALDSDSACTMLSFAARITALFSRSDKSDAGRVMASLLKRLTDVIFPPLPALELPALSLYDLRRPDVLPTEKFLTSHPDLLSAFFGFIEETIPKYSSMWTKSAVQRWMLYTLLALGNPEGGLAFDGAVKLLVCRQ
jgi:hypothetical protein